MTENKLRHCGQDLHHHCRDVVRFPKHRKTDWKNPVLGGHVPFFIGIKMTDDEMEKKLLRDDCDDWSHPHSKFALPGF